MLLKNIVLFIWISGFAFSQVYVGLHFGEGTGLHLEKRYNKFLVSASLSYQGIFLRTHLFDDVFRQREIYPDKRFLRRSVYSASVSGVYSFVQKEKYSVGLGLGVQSFYMPRFWVYASGKYESSSSLHLGVLYYIRGDYLLNSRWSVYGLLGRQNEFLTRTPGVNFLFPRERFFWPHYQFNVGVNYKILNGAQ